MNAVAMASPCERWALATCDHENPARASQAIRRDQRASRRNPAAASSVTQVHASAPANGIAIAISLVVMAPARESPPTVAASLPTPSTRRNPQSPRPATSGFSTTIARMALPALSTVNSREGGAYSHPLWGSAANR